MRFLKNKIALASQTKREAIPGSCSDISATKQSHISSPKDKPITPRRQKPKASSKVNEEIKSSKTVVKNYGKAIASFATSVIAIPYLTPHLQKENIQLNEFTKYISMAKDMIEGIDTFRALLLVRETDNNNESAYKRIFQRIGEVFIKYFSVNWIYSGRMTNKQVHLKCRFKMLRRILNPELFTYLK